MPRVSGKQREQYRQSKRQQILSGAIETFVTHGYTGASVADIAKAAGIGKGTLYGYFKGKEEIFTAILMERSCVPLWADLPGDGNVSLETALTQIAAFSLEQIQFYWPLFRLAIQEANRFPGGAEQFYRTIIHRPGKSLAACLSTQIQSGAIRCLDNPTLTAQIFMAMSVAYLLTQELMCGEQVDPIGREAWVHEVVQLFLKGIEA